MKNLQRQIEVLNDLLDSCDALKEASYAITIRPNQISIQAGFLRGIVLTMNNKGFYFNVTDSGWIQANKMFLSNDFGFDVEITLT